MDGPFKLQKQVNFLELNPYYVISCHNANVIDEKGKVINNSFLMKDRKKDFTSEELMCGRHLVTQSICFRNVIENFPKEFYKSLNGDTFLVSLLGEHGNSKFQKDINNGSYRLHSGGIWISQREIEKSKD